MAVVQMERRGIATEVMRSLRASHPYYVHAADNRRGARDGGLDMDERAARASAGRRTGRPSMIRSRSPSGVANSKRAVRVSRGASAATVSNLATDPAMGEAKR